MNIFNKAKDITGIGLNHHEWYNRAFEKGVNLKKFIEAADIFDKAARKAAEAGDRELEIRAGANALLYRYLDTGNANLITPLHQKLQSLPQNEEIRVSMNIVPIGPLAVELDCRLVESAIANAQNDIVRSRDLHKIANDKFQLITHDLITYQHVRADGPVDKALNRHFYHSGMYYFYEAMTKKDADPLAASEDLSKARQSFKRYNDQKWLPRVSELLKNWSTTRTCWVCHREMQGNELHYSMCRAQVTPYLKTLLEQGKQDSKSVDLDALQIAVCTACGSMITIKAQEEADIVRQELNKKLQDMQNLINSLASRVSHLESRVSRLRGV
jgi:hypothetical protein